MSTPWRAAAWMIVSPAKAEMVSPFSLKSMVSAVAASSFIFISDLVRKVLRDAANGIGGGLPEAADGGIGHRDRQLFQQLAVPPGLLHQVRGLHGADAAGRALAAGLVGEELHHVRRGVARLVGLRQDDHRRRADEAAMRLQRVEIERDVAHGGGQDAAGGAARKVGVELVAFEHAAAELV